MSWELISSIMMIRWRADCLEAASPHGRRAPGSSAFPLQEALSGDHRAAPWTPWELQGRGFRGMSPLGGKSVFSREPGLPAPGVLAASPLGGQGWGMRPWDGLRPSGPQERAWSQGNPAQRVLACSEGGYLPM